MKLIRSVVVGILGRGIRLGRKIASSSAIAAK